MSIPKVKINRGPQFPVDRARRERWAQELFEKFLNEPTADDIQYITSGDAMVLAHRVGPMINIYEMTITGEGVMAYRGWENVNASDDDDLLDELTQLTADEYDSPPSLSRLYHELRDDYDELQTKYALLSVERDRLRADLDDEVSLRHALTIEYDNLVRNRYSPPSNE